MKYFCQLYRKFYLHQLAVKGVYKSLNLSYSLKVSAVYMQTNVYVAHLLWQC